MLRKTHQFVCLLLGRHSILWFELWRPFTFDTD